MKKRLIALSAVLLLNLLLSEQALSTTLKIATLSPDGSYWMNKLREAGAEVTKQTAGRVKFKFYPGGVMGDDKAVLRKMRIHQLHGGAFTSNAVASFYRDIQVYNLLNAFQSFDEVDYVRAKMDADLIKGLEQGGIVPLGLAEIGFAYIMSLKQITSVQDIRSSKSWVPDNDINALEAIKSFGISPIPLPFSDVLLGLQSSMIETVAATPIAAIALQWHTQVKYVANVPLLYIFGVFALDKSVFEKLKPVDQKIVREVFARALHDINQQNRKDNLKATEALKHNEIKFLDPSVKDRSEFSMLAIKANEAQIAKGNISQNGYDILMKYIDDYRLERTASYNK